MNARQVLPAVVLSFTVLAACADQPAPSAPPTAARKPGVIPVYSGGPPAKAIKPTGRLDVADDTNPPPRTRYRIEYHNNQIVGGIPNVYFLWYGDWSATNTEILTDFASTVGSTPYFQIASLYPDSYGNAPSGAMVFGGQTAVYYTHGVILTDADVESIVTEAFANFQLPQDPDGLYVVMTSPDIWESSGLDLTYCAFHNVGTYNGSPYRYAFIGDPSRVPQRCAPQGVGPNGTVGPDALVSLLAGVLFNLVTDPYFTAWYDKLGLEGADKCVWNFGPTYDVNGSKANVHFGARDFLVQQLWVPSKSGGACGLTR